MIEKAIVIVSAIASVFVVGLVLILVYIALKKKL